MEFVNFLDCETQCFMSPQTTKAFRNPIQNEVKEIMSTLLIQYANYILAKRLNIINVLKTIYQVHKLMTL